MVRVWVSSEERESAGGGGGGDVLGGLGEWWKRREGSHWGLCGACQEGAGNWGCWFEKEELGKEEIEGEGVRGE